MAKKVTLEIIAGNRLVSGKKVTISQGKEPGKLFFNVVLKLFKQFKVEGIGWQEQTTRSTGKAAVGTIAGGLLAGPIGLIAGAAIGGRKRDKSAAVIQLVDDEGGVHPLHVRATAEELDTLQKLL